MTTNKLPLWRLIAGLAVLGSFAAVLVFLTPVYIDDLRLYRYTHSLTEAPDDTLIAEVVTKAHALDLPVKPTDIHIEHNGPKPKVEYRYTVKMDLLIYPVDLHFPTIR
jgi:hypothetical protein